MLHPPKWHVFLDFSVEKKVFRFAKRALRAGPHAIRGKISPAFPSNINSNVSVCLSLDSKT